MTTRAEIVAEAKTWLNVRWLHQGRGRNGLDCVGLPIVVGQKFGLIGEPPADYPRLPDGGFVQAFMDLAEVVSPVTDKRDGDILLFAERNIMCHCGIMITVYGQPGLIHATAASRKVIETALEGIEDWLGGPRYVFRYGGLED